MSNSTSKTTAATSNVSTNRGAREDNEQNQIAGDYSWQHSSWPFSPDDVLPLQWWRTMPADQLGDAQHLLLRTTLQNIATFTGRQWLACLHEDAAACIKIALRALGARPITEIALEVDLAMSFLMASALGGNAGSALVLSHILRRVPINRGFAKKLSVSWLELNLRRALEAKATKEGQALKTRHAPANRDTDDHRAAFYDGDVS
ncbi:hypothetical protein [Bradyrhizobium sp. G127]|uniref:hypothetical protein n=1 Tax=Bradyrhizobium sp. G127 TaxID=2904800 RepID=UPI001F3F20C8|nr:hypothetical protein [Bradyrhizobium sp. G127]MCF2521664.1 hypothetical protein [Bradyrhizobium sp. G127]